MEKDKQFWFLILCAIMLLGLTQFPYLLAFKSGGSEYVFSGFLINPLDGNSYLAKMYEGYRGDWTFTLPYTTQMGKGTYLFFFYILLGYIGRISKLPLISIYHLARVLSCICLIFALADFIETFIKDVWAFRFAMILTCFGAGMGWLVMPSGYITSDFWVAEAYPFLSSLINPHFCLGISLMLWLIKVLNDHRQPKKNLDYFSIGAASLILALLAPFAFVIVVVLSFILIAEKLIFLVKEKRSLVKNTSGFGYRGLFWALLGGVPMGLYELYVMKVDPLLNGWQAQNITPSPPFWDFILSFSPMLILAIAGLFFVHRDRYQKWRPIVAWLVVGAIFIYLPWSLQRRFLFGYFVPIIMLAMLPLQYLRTQKLIKGFWFSVLLFILLIATFTTNIVLELTTFYGIKTKDPLLFLTKSESQALHWIEKNTPTDALILASPQMGLFIPAQTGRRVIYGHPFETVDAANREAQVTAFYSDFRLNNNQAQEEDYLVNNEVDYIFWGERERLLSKFQPNRPIENRYKPVYQDGEVTIYQVVQ